MLEVLQALFWAIFGVAIDKLWDSYGKKSIIKVRKNYIQQKKSSLYKGSRCIEYVKMYYKDCEKNQLAVCRLGQVNITIPFLTLPEWKGLSVDLLRNKNVLKYVETNVCDYPINNKEIKIRQSIGQKLFDDPSLFLHRVNLEGNKICFEVGEYNYFKRLSFFSDFENETYLCAVRGKKRKAKLRDRYLPSAREAASRGDNIIPIGCDTAVVIKRKGEYYVALHYRSSQTANYSSSAMVVPSFGFGSIKNIKGNPLLFSFLKEYSEELFNREEVETIGEHSDPEWFVNQFVEIQDIIKLIKQNEFYFTLLGCGFDPIGGFFNLSTVAIIDNEEISEKVFENCVGNWETDRNLSKTIGFVPLFGKEIERLALELKAAPSTLYTLSCVQNYVKSNVYLSRESAYMGVDIGASSVKVCITKGSGSIQKTSFPTPTKANDFIAELATILKEATQSTSVNVVGMAFAIPGRVDNNTCAILSVPNISWLTNSVISSCEEYFHCKIAVINDANAGAYYEKGYGCLKGIKHAIYLSMGTGVGGCAVCNGQLDFGAHGQAGEFGHIIICSDGKKCPCGQYGCWETYFSTKAILEKLKLIPIADENISLEYVAQMLRKKDEHYIKMFDEFLKYYEIGIINLMQIYDPEVICLGGGLVQAFPEIKTNTEVIISKMNKKANVFLAEHDKYSCAMGAADYLADSIKRNAYM